MGEFTVSLREEDLYRGFRLNGVNRRARPLLWAVLVCVLLIAALLAASPSSLCLIIRSPGSMMLVGAVLLAAFLVALVLGTRNMIWRSMARRTLEQRRELGTPIQWAFDEQGVRIITRFTSSAVPWDALRGWREDQHVLLVYLADQLFHSVPKEQVDAATLDTLRDALESHGVPRR
jgi:hypothetical protein